MSKKPLLALYSAAHFWVDLSCAFLVFRTLSGGTDFLLCLLLYNFCAFALQMPLGLLADRLDRNSAVAAAGCGLTALAYLPLPAMAAAVTAGLGNALFHLGGGLDALNASEKKAAWLGIFVSPGAVGLYVGTLWGRGQAPALWLGPLGLAALGGAILWLGRRTMEGFASGNAPMDPVPAEGCGPLVPLFLVVVLRSYMGMNQSFAWKGQGAWGLVLVLALALGKAAGGVLSDRLGPRRTAAGSLALAAALYLLCGLPLPGTLAVFLFNMTMPLTLWAAARIAPGAKGFTFGLLTFALFLGWLPSYLGWPALLTAPWTYAAVSLISLALLWRPMGREAARC